MLHPFTFRWIQVLVNHEPVLWCKLRYQECMHAQPEPPQMLCESCASCSSGGFPYVLPLTDALCWVFVLTQNVNFTAIWQAMMACSTRTKWTPTNVVIQYQWHVLSGFMWCLNACVIWFLAWCMLLLPLPHTHVQYPDYKTTTCFGFQSCKGSRVPDAQGNFSE